MYRIITALVVALALTGIHQTVANQIFMPAVVAPAPTPTFILTATPTDTPTRTATPETPTTTPTNTPTPTPTDTSEAETETPTATPTETDTPTVTPTSTETTQNGPCSCAGDLYNCSDFSTHAQAQACFNWCESQGRGDVHHLDSDGDGDACESLPGNFVVIR